MTEQHVASIPEIGILEFYPKDIPEIAVIFNNRIARTLWLAIKFQHLTDQHFNEGIATITPWIEDGELDAEDDEHAAMQLYTWLIGWRMIGDSGIPFCRKLIPYIRGNKTIAYRLPNGDLIGGTQAEMELI